MEFDFTQMDEAANPLVSSRLDYCKSLFESLSSFNICKELQCIQNALTMIVTNCYIYSQASPYFKQFHWLPVEFC